MARGNAQDGFSGAETAQIVGITYRQLDYWARTDLVRPSLEDAKGSGSRRRYSYHDLLELKVIKNLLDAGIRLESVRDVFIYLREHLGEDVTRANLVIQGNTVGRHPERRRPDRSGEAGPGRAQHPPARRREGRSRRQHPSSCSLRARARR